MYELSENEQNSFPIPFKKHAIPTNTVNTIFSFFLIFLPFVN